MSEISTLSPCPKGCVDHPQHMVREICRDMNSPNWNKPVSRVWCPCCGLTMIRLDIEEVQQAWNTRAESLYDPRLAQGYPSKDEQ